MQTFIVNLVLKIITISDNDNDNRFLVLLDEEGNFPTVNLKPNKNHKEQILEKLSEFVYEDELLHLIASGKISDIEIKDDTINIQYNYISISTQSKKGAYTVFDKKSMELYRLANIKSL
jgi:hypothetical protein